MNSIVEYEFIKNDDKKDKPKPNEVIITFHPIKKNNIFIVDYKKYKNINKIISDITN
jgi:hypothetical protein